MRMTWSKLARSKRYRGQFISATSRRAFAFQLRSIMKRRGLSQGKLAEMSGLTQGVISRAADPNYGKLTVTIKAKIANGLDMAYIGTLVPFSEAEKWISGLSEDAVQVPTFEEENEALEKAEREAELASHEEQQLGGLALAGKLKQKNAGANELVGQKRGPYSSGMGGGVLVNFGAAQNSSVGGLYERR
jgi:transcriptional regulator with XRE-family HTH domain